MTQPLKARTALVTGASGGIGSRLAACLAAQGATVAVHARERSAADAVATEIREQGGAAISIAADLATQAGVVQMFAELDGHWPGGLDILVNNAGTAALSPIAGTDEETVDRVFAVNVKAPLFSMREASSRLNRGGRIINISSTTARFPMPNVAVYAASKAALEMMTQIAALEYGPQGITVNAVQPGPTIPGMFSRAPAEHRERAAASSPFGRVGTPDDIAHVVAFLAGEPSRWITGQVIQVNGGATI